MSVDRYSVLSETLTELTELRAQTETQAAALVELLATEKLAEAQKLLEAHPDWVRLPTCMHVVVKDPDGAVTHNFVHQTYNSLELHLDTDIYVGGQSMKRTWMIEMMPE